MSDPNISSVVIGSDTTFETHFEAHANRGKKIIIGNDCMFSHNVYLLSGDGHAIFDVNSGKNINSMYQAASFSRNSIVIGNHVWVGYGAFILHGTNVGAGSIVGAQSVGQRDLSKQLCNRRKSRKAYTQRLCMGEKHGCVFNR